MIIIESQTMTKHCIVSINPRKGTSRSPTMAMCVECKLHGLPPCQSLTCQEKIVIQPSLKPNTKVTSPKTEGASFTLS